MAHLSELFDSRVDLFLGDADEAVIETIVGCSAVLLGITVPRADGGAP